MRDVFSKVTLAHGKMDDKGQMVIRLEIETQKTATVYQVGDHVGFI